MKHIATIVATAALVAGTAQSALAQGKEDERLTKSAAVIREIMATPDKGIPQTILAGASCVVVIPDLKKGAFLVGGSYGQGVATCRTGHGWSAPVFVALEEGSFGFQIGGQSTDLVLVAMNHGGLDHMLKDKFKMGADASVAAGPVGRNAQAATDATLHAEFLTYSRSRGVFAGLDLSGATLHENTDDTRKFYDAAIPFQTILGGQTPTPPAARPFVGTVAKYFVVSRENH